MLQSRWSKLTFVAFTFAFITVIVNLVVYKFSSLIIIANTNFSSIVLIADFLTGAGSYSNKSAQIGAAASRLWSIFRILEPAPESSAESRGFRYVIAPRVTCSGAVIVICVTVRPGDFRRRDTIRETWGSYANDTGNNATLVFFLGLERPSADNDTELTQRSIFNESDRYGDILQEDYVDSYSNLSLKSVSILRYVSQQCPNSQYVLKSDDDVYANVPLLMLTLKALSAARKREPFILGHAFHGARPIRDSASKWYTPAAAYNESFYPSYASGSAYAMTTPAAGLLYLASTQVPVFWLEDVYITGLCARKVNVSLVHSSKFNYLRPEPTGCSFISQITGHRLTTTDIATIHKELYDTKLKCA